MARPRKNPNPPPSPSSSPVETITKTIKLHQVQHDFHHSQSLYRGFVGGRGSGKSYVGAYDLLRRAMSDEGRDRLYMIISPTYMVLQDATMRTVYQIAEDLNIIKERWKQPPRLVLSNNSEIIFRSGDDPERLRGPNLSGVWLDEASIMTEEVFNICIASLREGNRAGWLTATFTPKGTGHWTYDIFGSGIRENAKLFKSATKNNPFLPAEFVNSISKQYSDRQSSQELDGEFIDQEGSEWPNSHFGENLWVDEFPPDENLTIKIVSVDPSKGREARHGDFTAIVSLARDREGTLYCDSILRRLDAESLVNLTISEVDRFAPDGLVIESNQFQHLLAGEIYKESKSRGIAVPIIQLYNTISKEVRIRRLGPYLANKTLRFVRSEGNRILMTQMREFPKSKFDDGPDALEMALRAMISMWNGRRAKDKRRIIS